MVLVQKWLFFQLLFLGNIGKENVFYGIRKRKNAFLGLNNKKLKKSRRIDIIPKLLTHGFDQNIAIFPTFFLGTIDEENIFYDILKRRNAFLVYKKKKFKQLKN